MKKHIRKIYFLGLAGLIFLSIVLWGGNQASGKEIIIKDILAKDFIGVVNPQEPRSYDSVKFLIENRPSYRTGWSGYVSVCNTSRSVDENGNPILDPITGEQVSPWEEVGRWSTDDSGRDKRYNVEDYRTEILAQLTRDYGSQFAEEYYEAALATGKSLVYQDGSKTEPINSVNHHPLPCKGNGNEAESDKGFFYNNLDFSLTMTFTVSDIKPPPPSKESVRIEPSTRTVEVGETGSYKLYHYDNDGNKTDVTDAATWSISSNMIGKPAGKGSFEGLSVGSTNVTATYKSYSDNASFNVIEEIKRPEVTIYGPTTVMAGEEFNLRADVMTGSGEIVQYIWDVPGSDSGTPNKDLMQNLMYLTEGEKFVQVYVEDDRGYGAGDYHFIEVVPPEPKASIGAHGTLKQNRKVTIDGSKSNSPKHFPIISTQLEITPLDGQNVGSIKYTGSLSGVNTKDVVFKETGEYEAKITIVNKAGMSDTQTIQFSIEPDLPPIANFYISENKTFRDPANNNIATVTLVDVSMSVDQDIIKKRIWKYRYDSNNNGNFDDENWILLDDNNETNIPFRSKNIGRYEFSLEVHEEFGQPTIVDFILPSDYLKDDTSNIDLQDKTLLIDNKEPSVRWGK